ncbi:MAG: hypothetical protein ACREIQ_01635 [Nitrospiria bacterium]
MEVIEKLKFQIQEMRKRVKEKRKTAANFRSDPDLRKMRKKLRRMQRKRLGILAQGKTAPVAKEKKEKKAVATQEIKETTSETKS